MWAIFGYCCDLSKTEKVVWSVVDVVESGVCLQGSFIVGFCGPGSSSVQIQQSFIHEIFSEK